MQDHARGTSSPQSFHLHPTSYIILVLCYGAFLIATIQHTSSLLDSPGLFSKQSALSGIFAGEPVYMDQAWALEVAQKQNSQLQTFNLQLANKVDVFNF